MKDNNVENVIENYTSSAQAKQGRPTKLPSKFWNEETGELKIEELINDYVSLVERDSNLVETSLRELPESYDKYEINIPNDFFVRDEDVLKKLYDNGFSNKQAQVVYDLANEKILPILSELTIDFEAQKQLDKLVGHFGSKEKFDEVARQISSWAKQNLSPEVYDVLGSTSEGVLTLYKMMSSPEPMLLKERGEREELNESTLKEMMKDPRYWRDKDSAYINKIKNGFEKLYPGTEE